MKLVKAEKIETNQYQLEIAIGAEEFEAAIAKTYRKNVKQINMPGFRRGKAPRKMIEKVYGEGVFYEDAINEIYPSAYSDAIDEAKIEPVDKAEIEMSEVTKDGFSFTATVTVKPEITVKNYKGIEAVKYIAEVTDAEINAELTKMRERAGRIVPIEDRAALDGDTAVINFEGFCDGIAFEGGKGENYPLQLGSGQFIPGFEEQVLGKNIGDTFDVEVTFPEEYNETSLAGKPAIFKCSLNELKAKELPELDDELAKDMSEFSTLEELKADIKAKAQTRKDKEAQDDVENRLIDTVIENMEAEIPQCMFDHKVDQSIKEFDYRLQSQGLNLDSYIQYTGSDMETFRKTFAVQADKQVKIRLALEKIVELENIVVAEEDINAEFESMAQNYGMKVEEVKKAVTAEDISKDLAVNKAIDLVRDSAVITNETASASAEETPAKKKVPAKKKASAKKKAEDAE